MITRSYPGQTTTPLCPTETFGGEPIYVGSGPDAEEVAQRCQQYWQPYHDALQSLIKQRIDQHGFAVLLDAHSILSTVPRLFPGRLPDINVGTYGAAAWVGWQKIKWLNCCRPSGASRTCSTAASRVVTSHVPTDNLRNACTRSSSRSHNAPIWHEHSGVCSTASMAPLQALLEQIPAAVLSAANAAL